MLSIFLLAATALSGASAAKEAAARECASLLQSPHAGNAMTKLKGVGDSDETMFGPDRSRSFEDFVDELCTSIRARRLDQDSLEYALEELAPELRRDTLWLEFGVWRGASLDKIGKRSLELGRSRKAFGFDSFQGLPEAWRTSKFKNWKTQKGSFDREGRPPYKHVDPAGADFVVGWFNESLPPFLARESGGVSLVHIDSDLYSSALTVLTLLTPRLVPGAVIVFDELVNYPEFRGGEMRALHEWLESKEFHASGLHLLQVVGFEGPGLLTDVGRLRAAMDKQGQEQGRYPQSVAFRVW